MSTRFTKPLVFFAVLTVFVIGSVLLALPFFVSTEIVRNAVQRELSDFTGQTVRLRGDIDLTLFPTPVAALDDLFIPSENGNDEPFLEVERVTVDIAAFSIFTAKPEFTGFTLVRPRLNLRRDAEGIVNWRHGFGRISSASNVARRTIAQKQELGETELPQPNALLDANFPRKLGRIEIIGGMISVTDMLDETFFTASAIDGVVDWPAIDTPISIVGTAIMGGNQFDIAGSAEKPLVMLADQISQADLTVSSDIGALTFSGALGYFGELFADGDLSIDVRSMPAVMDFVGTEIEAGKAFSVVEASGPAQIKSGKAVFRDLQITIDGNSGIGVLELAHDADAPPLLAGTLDFETLDIRSFLGAFLELPESAEDTSDPIDMSIMSQLRADLRISASQASFDEIVLQNVAASTQIKEGAAIFDLGDAEAYGGSIQARLQFTVGADGNPQMQTRFSGQNIDLQLAAEALALPPTLPLGSATLSLDAEAPFGSWSALIENSEGIASFKMAGGITRGFGVARLVREEAANQFFTLSNNEASDEQFDSLVMEGQLSDGVINITNAEINYPEGVVQFEGVAPLSSSGIALTATATPATEDNSADPRRFFIGGSWERAFATPLIPPPLALQ